MTKQAIFDHEHFRTMHIIATHIDEISILALHGRFLGDHDADNFCDAIKLRLDDGTRKIIIDLGAVDYINSMGLGALIAGFVIASNAGGRLVYANANPRVRELLVLTKTDKSVPVYDTVDEAKMMFA